MKQANKGRRIVILSVFILVIILAVIGVWYCYSLGVHTGMSRMDYLATIPDEARFDYLDFSFYKNLFGDPVVVRFNLDADVIADIQVYPKLRTDTSLKAFSELEKGMSIYDVVSKVGVPYRSSTSGMISMDFIANDGTVFCIYWKYVENGNEKILVVSDITTI